MSQTPVMGWPYPLSSDLIAKGATNMQQIDEAIEGNTYLAANKFGPDDAWNGYPAGLTLFRVGGVPGWPYTSGHVMTLKAAGVPYAHQLFYRYSSSGTAVTLYLRQGWTSSGGDPTWSTWQTVAGLGTPNAMAAGRVSMTPPAGGGTVSTTVMFPSGRFVSGDVQGPIRMQIQAVTASPEGVSASFNAATPTSVNLYLYRPSGPYATGVDWVATQGLEPASS